MHDTPSSGSRGAVHWGCPRDISVRDQREAGDLPVVRDAHEQQGVAR